MTSLRRATRVAASVAAILLALLIGAPAATALLVPDPSFGGDGFAMLDDPAGTNEQLYDALIQPDGRILGGGLRGGSQGFLLARFNADGSPDAGFGSGGISVEGGTDPGDPRGIDAIVARPDGKVVAAGLGAGPAANAFQFARYLPNGELDPGFGVGGLRNVTVIPFGAAQSVALAPDGKVVAAGRGDGEAVVVRLTENGTPDNDFNLVPAGIKTVDPTGGDEEGRAVAVLADGTILIGGPAAGGAFLAELDAEGEPVMGFGSSGVAIEDLGTAPTPAGVIEDLEVLSDGRIIVTGYAPTPDSGDSQVVVARFTPGGDLDPTFGAGGIARVNPTLGDEAGYALEIAPDGTIVVAGESNGAVLVVGLTPAGQPDPGFGPGGVVTASPGPEASAIGLALGADGRPVIVGKVAGLEGLQLLAGRFVHAAPAASRPAVFRVRCGGRAATIVGTAKVDKLRGTRRADVIAALGGHDTILSLAGNDLVCGGGGRDAIQLGKGRDRGLGEGGADRILGGPGKDRLLGGGGGDALSGGPGRDVCNGGAGKERSVSGCETEKRVP